MEEIVNIGSSNSYLFISGIGSGGVAASQPFRGVGHSTGPAKAITGGD